MSEENQEQGTSIEVGGIKFTGGKMMILFTALSTAGGALWGGFEVYSDYMAMKEQIQSYVAPDLSGIEQKIAVAQENIDKTKQNIDTSVQYTQDIKNDLKHDIRELESVVERMERSNRDLTREVNGDIKDIRKDVDDTLRNISTDMIELEKDLTDRLKDQEKHTDEKIQKALDNPLAN